LQRDTDCFVLFDCSEHKIHEVRPPWIPNDKTPRDIDRSRLSMHAELSESVVRAVGRFDRHISTSTRTMNVGTGIGLGSTKVNELTVDGLQASPAPVHRLIVVSAPSVTACWLNFSYIYRAFVNLINVLLESRL
jgi:hypothetical protein